MKAIEMISELLICLFEVYMFQDFFGAIFGFKREAKAMHFVVPGILMAMIFWVNSFSSSLINLAVIPILYLIAGNFLFEGKIRRKIVYLVVFYTILAGVEIIFEFLFSVEVFNNFYNSLLIIMLEKILTFAIFRVIKLFVKDSSKYSNDGLFWYFFILPIASFMVYAGILYSEIELGALSVPKVVLLGGCFGLLFANALVFYLFERMSQIMYRKNELELLHMKTNMEEKHYEKLEQINHEHRQYIHNMGNYLKTIGSLAKKGQNEAIIKILAEMEIKVESIREEIFCGHPVLNAILCERKEQAITFDIDFQAYVEPRADVSFIQDFDLIAMAGNLLDNAVEAASKLEKKSFVDVHIFVEEKGHFVIFKIENNYSIKPQQVGNKFMTIKNNKERHGIGMDNVRELAEKYGGFLQVDVEEDVFTTLLALAVSRK